jgi:hypothetical protein
MDKPASGSNWGKVAQDQEREGVWVSGCERESEDQEGCDHVRPACLPEHGRVCPSGFGVRGLVFMLGVGVCRGFGV